MAGDTAGVINNDNGDGLALLWVLGAGSTFTGGSERSTYTAFSNGDVAPTQTVNLADNTANEWMITGVQLEVGEQATPFEHRSFGDELSRCQRYFQYIESFTFTNNVTGDYNGTRFTRLQPMRVAPTDTIISTATEATGEIRYQDGAADVAAATSSKPESFNCYVNNASTAVGSNMFFRLKSDAEL